LLSVLPLDPPRECARRRGCAAAFDATCSLSGCPGAVAVKGRGCPHCVDTGADLDHRAGAPNCVPALPGNCEKQEKCGEHFLVPYMPLAACAATNGS